ncbi:hypothetical protein B0A48_18564 [Cryoendolithus antarcticus]|uniref:Uncharacterized protein n=1 Tax=Cryoendolithus antarcticus TaxID=1507870 RepID=A0A1V8S8E3_9PEZI|nr:hypothetical protein B0A48_18564 [Cryoendolithus antarcticus]
MSGRSLSAIEAAHATAIGSLISLRDRIKNYPVFINTTSGLLISFTIDQTRKDRMIRTDPGMADIIDKALEAITAANDAYKSVAATGYYVDDMPLLSALHNSAMSLPASNPASLQEEMQEKAAACTEAFKEANGCLDRMPPH